jgi:outer membrane biosynthesis protein TonB
VVLAETSGNINYDQIALRAISDASPFPPLPNDQGELSLTVKLQFRFDLDPRSGIEGELIPLGSTDGAYGGYLDRVRRMIKEKWGYPCVKDVASGHCEYKSGEVLIEFGIFKDGRVPYIKVLQPLEWTTYNDYAVNAIRLGAPFPPAPRELMARAAPGSAGVRIVAKFTYALEHSSLTNDLR